MANQDIKTPKEYDQAIRKLETSDPAHADTFNPLFEKLINNDAYLKEQQDKLIEYTGPLSTERLSKDSNDIYVEVRYKRANGSLLKKSVLSDGVSPKYTTRTETYYAADGIAVLFTKVYSLTYTGDDLTSEVIV